jgi:hypothetical protein
MLEGDVDGKYGIGPNGIYAATPRDYALGRIGYEEK